MIKSNVINKFPNHNLVSFVDNIYIADYTEQTRYDTIKRAVEVLSPIPFTDINYLSIINPNKVKLETIIFDNNSFKYTCGNPKSQCETSSFPSISNDDSWILFSELKYSCKAHNNIKNLKKAIKQLFKTRYHYLQSNIFDKNKNTSYLIASLPLQTEPFANFSLTQSYLINLKSKHNIILRLQNSIEIIDESLILV
ncbi:hypothetical protein G1K97_13270 [Tenacibaculum finnmarkense]|uniref:hypothetical protein n=1 Tax=Tenacibaculum finnmarkense TaxID=2781243 RepID=UPI001EFB47E5|nr:hypothetical protein [Tenacibaculum finnmarkense]MCG8894733.1 hypothetical protein [Tenacibaculum finnmarkense]MCG8902802.1 hypothetical protein [Tenacibaculum finnmarkense]